MTAPFEGRRIGGYEVLSRLGAGGMGEVYRARDVRLGRDVAIKVLPQLFTQDPERLARFEREARVLASLNHPNIGAIYGLEDPTPVAGAAATRALVLELVEGGTLAELIVRGTRDSRSAGDTAEARPTPPRSRPGLTVAAALKIAEQVAAALGAAHDKAIVHRDLKPANIMITPAGVVKVLDFGLAKATTGDATATPDLSHSPTMTIGGTREGVILGTAAYMSPEQTRGHVVDKRTDIWAFGCVLYEMLAGRVAFAGATVSDTIVSILEREPDWSALPGTTPAKVRDLLRKCLQKDSGRRLHDIADARIEIEDAISSGESERLLPPASPERGERRSRRRYVVAAVFLVAALAGGLWWASGMGSNRTASPAPLRRLTSGTGLTTDSAISPDGKLVAYASDRAGHDDLDIWVQQVDGGSPLRLTSDPAKESEPSFSPDGNQMVFRSDRDGGGIYTIPTLGGESRLIAKGGRNPRFSPDGTHIAYVTGVGGPGGVSGGELFVVPAVGGTPQRLVPKDAGAAHPVWSPDSKSILFALGAYRIDSWGIVSAVPEQASSPIGLSLSELTKAGLADLTPGAWDASNRIVFSAKSGDSSHVFELVLSPPSVLSKQWRIGSSRVRLTSGTEQDEKPSLTAAAGGARRLAFTSLVRSENLWSLAVDPNQPRAGGKIQRLTEAAGAFHVFPDISSDGTNVVYVSHAAYKDQVWVLDLKTGRGSSFRHRLPASCCSNPTYSRMARVCITATAAMLAGFMSSPRPAALRRNCAAVTHGSGIGPSSTGESCTMT